MSELIVQNLGVRSGQRTLVSNASYTLTAGELVALIGPNGAGKTSLLQASLGIAKASSGSATLDSKNTAALTPSARARNVAYLPQIRPLAWPNKVRDVVAMGRFSHGTSLARLSSSDVAAIDRALKDCDLYHLAQRQADTLSGGELARMHCARAFAAQAPLLVADEPIAALDPRHQFRILDLIADYVRRGSGALVVLHDIQLAARYATRLIWMKEGCIVADGSPSDTITSERLESTFGIRANLVGARLDIEGAI